ncbi:hypothetical protein BDF20DRAFT_911636 [Mycotypha africana]|uniref:uncharacterized protein n=1 Tax=Mycotypha africana TaxID=64632 RepID=UPI0022FFDAE7|nr:uncharacterized protein BDF20DRAFT_911636 [Mycotypha africana]KAI8984547.1 hypothetical protein BDF20DRAFT_911636 [Mycotypha africana]
MNQSGATAQSKEFQSRERAAENQYARKKEAEQLQKLKEQLDATAKKDSNEPTASQSK